MLDFFFEISHFLLIYDGLDENYVIYTELKMTALWLSCSKMRESVCKPEGMYAESPDTVLFSATLHAHPVL